MFHFEFEILYWDFASYFFILFLTLKWIQSSVFAALKPLKRKPRFTSSFIDPKCQTSALLLLF